MCRAAYEINRASKIPNAEASSHAACLQGVGEHTPLCVVARCHGYASPANSGAARETSQLHCLFFFLTVTDTQHF